MDIMAVPTKKGMNNMFCVIQKIVNKKPNEFGGHKELLVDSYTFGIVGQEQKTKYTYKYSDERFERPVKDAYKISIHESYRDDSGRVKKKQWAICTMGYYSLLESWAGDYLTKRELEEKIKSMGISEDELWEMVYKKLDPLVEKATTDFQQTEEYKAKQKHDAILAAHREAEKAFEEIYGDDTYFYCYDIFGELRNAAYLEKVKADKIAQDEYTKRSYQSRQESNYNSYSSGSYFAKSNSTYNEDEKKMLKKIYREASKKFHPDVANDDGSMMKFLTRLKEEWGI